MKEILMFILSGCPHCRMALRLRKRLLVDQLAGESKMIAL